jgi:hypothetical protein
MYLLLELRLPSFIHPIVEIQVISLGARTPKGINGIDNMD